ncbi:alpha-L-fucosidase [Saccharicrinis fermentans]|uniref:alpha-L-fucosidase n=1 Tax=Saccharicrinis fermentans DSM 9555 = JCM 21142 TaxID=869213 RepID=W7YHY0_9BACT|nr:alpha-L-fucosidase [Saccharicrinis fermentans]GAF02174.1 alpha-L-fucosidase [Saccharicrinis fermentans DSM 9555 = JCM 21142]
MKYVIVLLILIPLMMQAQVNADGTIDTGDKFANAKLEQRESSEIISKRLEWWKEARFGMFIHWGLYAQDGCFWNGKDGRSEHMMRNLQIPIADYEKIANEFDPVDFDADEWVRIAKDAGMKYMILTSKHHDGFAMFNSPSSNYNIVKRTPFKRDPVKELSEACAKEGLRFGVYYSLGRDWHDPDCNSVDGWRSNIWDYPNEAEKDFSKYFERKVKPQMIELINQYHPAIIWFDTPELISKQQSEELLALIHGLDPTCIVNQRVGNKLGDYAVREQKIPAGGEPQPWETCMTLNGAWGYHKTDDNWKSADSLVHSLVDIASKGGNFLLNVGPTGKGIIPARSVERLKEVGRWLDIYGESIYGTSSSPFGKLPWGRCTKKVSKEGVIVYLAVFDWPSDGKLLLNEAVNVKRASLLNNPHKKLKIRKINSGISIELPLQAPNKMASVVKLVMESL